MRGSGEGFQGIFAENCHQGQEEGLAGEHEDETGNNWCGVFLNSIINPHSSVHNVTNLPIFGLKESVLEMKAQRQKISQM